MTRIRILYADTDMAGVVYHANYLRYFEQARTEQLYAAGIDLATLHHQQGIVFAISECSLRYHRSAHYGDVIVIDVFPTKVGPARVTLRYEVTVEGDEGVYVTGRNDFRRAGREHRTAGPPTGAERRFKLAAQQECTDG